MIAVAVREYDDQNIHDDCEAGWKRFCAEVLVRSHYHIQELCRRHRRLGFAGMLPASRKDWEILRRQVAAYQWVFCGTGGLFSFAQSCADLGLDPSLIRAKTLSHCKPERDINRLVAWVARQKEKACGDGRGQSEVAHRLGASPEHLLRDFRSRYGKGASRRGAQTHAVCRYSNRNQD